MLHILFLILKILGIVVLIVFALILLLLTIILLIPVRYKIEAMAEGDLKSVSACAKASWILRTIAVDALYEHGKFVWSLRIFGIKVRKRKKKDSINKDDLETESTASESSKTEHVYEEQCDCKKRRKKKQSLWKKIKCTFKNICAKIKKIWKNIQHAKEFLTNETHGLAFNIVKSEIYRLAKHLRPRKLKGEVRYGLEDPYHTGLVLAGLSVLYPFLDERLSIYPDFEKKVLEGQVCITGNMRAVVFLRIIIKLFFDKNVKQTYKNYKNKG